MIRINNSDIPVKNYVSQIERVIGITSDNNFETRTFVMPRIYRGIDISDDNYTFLLQVKNSTNKPYYNILEKNIVGDEVELTWKIQRHDCIVGKIEVSIIIQSEQEDVVKQTYNMVFECLQGIDAVDSAQLIPQSVFEQAVVEAAAHAQNAKVEADRAKRIMYKFDNKIQGYLDRLKKIEEVLGLDIEDEEEILDDI